MDAAARKGLIGRIEAQPEQFAAQEQVALSTAPVYTEAGIAARHVVLRVFAAWDGHVLHGAARRTDSRFDERNSSPAVSLHRGAGARTPGCPAARESQSPSRARRPGAIAAHPSWTNLPSRVADNLFWLGRYAERVEDRIRLVRALLPALSGEEDFGRTATLEPVVQLLTGLEYLPPEVSRASLGEQLWRVQRLLANMVRDESRPIGLGWNLKQMRRVALHLKERLSADTWRVLQQIDSDFSKGIPDRSSTSVIFPR